MTTTTNLRTTRKQAAAKVLAKTTPATKAATRKKESTPPKAAPAAPVAKAPEVAAIPLPKNAEALRHLIGVQKARRYRAGRRGARRRGGPARGAPRAPGCLRGCTEAEVAKVPVPADAGELAHLIGVQKARRWRAGRRGDAALLAMLSERIAYLEKGRRPRRGWSCGAGGPHCGLGSHGADSPRLVAIPFS